MSMRRKATVSILFLITLMVIGISLWILPKRLQPSSASPGQINVTVAQTGQFFIYMPLYYAQQRGFFAKNGLNVTIINSGGDEKSVAAVIAGSADFGVGDPTFAAVAAEHGQGVKVVASVVNGVPFWGVTKDRSIEPITNPSQLRGLTVATFPSPSTAYVLQAQMFRDGGLPPSIKQVQFGSLLPLLDTNEVGIVLELEPNVSTAVAQGAHIVYSMASKYPDFDITGVTVSDRTLQRRPYVVRRFVTALNQAEQAAHANPADLIAFAGRQFPNVPPQIAKAAITRMLDAGVFPRTAMVSAPGWANAINLRVQAGDLDSSQWGNGVVDNVFLNSP